MDIDDDFPLKLWFNQGPDEYRRMQTEEKLEEIGIQAERFPGIRVPAPSPCRTEAKPNSSGPSGMRIEKPMRGYANAAEYGRALTLRLGIREARRRGAPAVLLLEDSWVIHPNFKALFSSVETPEDWGVLLLGCAHLEPPSWAGTRLVKVARAEKCSGIAIHSNHYRMVMKMLDRRGKEAEESTLETSYSVWAETPGIAIHACYPNLLWQDGNIPENNGIDGPNFTRDGKQAFHVEAVEHLLPELISGEATEPDVPQRRSGSVIIKGHPRPVKIGLLFLTRGDVHHPSVWREFVAQAPEQIAIYAHAKHPDQLAGGFLEGFNIEQRHETEWGDISLVRATRSLLQSALKDEEITHFALLSEACVPLQPLSHILRRFTNDSRSQFDFQRVDEATPRQSNRAKAAPEIPRGCWRFQSQWWIMNRVAASFAVGRDFTEIFEKTVVPDEAYFATVLAMQGFPLEGEVVRKDSTWTNWRKGAGSPREWTRVPLERIQELIHSGAVFGRKFLKDSDIGKYGLHRPNHLQP